MTNNTNEKPPGSLIEDLIRTEARECLLDAAAEHDKVVDLACAAYNEASFAGADMQPIEEALELAGNAIDSGAVEAAREFAYQRLCAGCPDPIESSNEAHKLTLTLYNASACYAVVFSIAKLALRKDGITSARRKAQS